MALKGTQQRATLEKCQFCEGTKEIARLVDGKLQKEICPYCRGSGEYWVGEGGREI
jgi:hypothetical protein